MQLFIVFKEIALYNQEKKQFEKVKGEKTMESLIRVSQYLTNHANQLATEIIQTILTQVEEERKPSEQELAGYERIYATFIELLAEAIPLTENELPQAFLEMSKQLGEKQAASKGQISEVTKYYPTIRSALIDRITDVSIEQGLTTKNTVFVNKRLHYMIDQSMKETLLAFERMTDKLFQEREKEIKESRRLIYELSAPIVPIQDGIAVLPLVGAFDHDRVEQIMKKVLPSIPSLQINCLIIDFSGIVGIDAEVAGHLFKIYDVLYLLGIQIAFTGIRSDLAVNAVKSGIDFSRVRTYSTLKQAINSNEIGKS